MILGLGSPVARHTKDATPPEMPVWSSGDLMKLGMPEERGGSKSDTSREGKRERRRGAEGRVLVSTACHVSR